MIDAGGDNRNANDAIKVFVECRTDDDVRILIDFFANTRGRLVDFVKRKIAAAGDGDKKAFRACIEASSINGLEIAASAAAIARLSPRPRRSPSSPCPFRA